MKLTPPAPNGFLFVVDEPAIAGEESESMPMGRTLGMMLLEGFSELRIKATSGVSFSSRFELDDLS